MADAKIFTNQNGPLTITNVENISDSKGPVEHNKTQGFCRCGNSKNKPFCDGTHSKIMFSGEKENKNPNETNNFASEEITIKDTPKVCAHAGYCDGGLPKVFWTEENGKRIAHPKNEEDIQKLQEIIQKCPSGSLAYEIDGKIYDSYETEPSIFIVPNGPYAVKGSIEFKDEENGDQPQSKEHYTLCRCGASKNKPFCDGSHHKIKFDEHAQQKESSE